jgi:hypothetical protein
VLELRIAPIIPSDSRAQIPAMLSLSLRSTGATYTVGPSAWIEFRGGQVFLEGRAEPIARYETGAWVHSGRRCFYLECRAILCICFLDVNGRPRSVAGPRALMCIRDCHMFAGRQRLAKLTPDRGLWTRLNTSEGWPVLRIVPSVPRNEERSTPI